MGYKKTHWVKELCDWEKFQIYVYLQTYSIHNISSIKTGLFFLIWIPKKISQIEALLSESAPGSIFSAKTCLSSFVEMYYASDLQT